MALWLFVAGRVLAPGDMIQLYLWPDTSIAGKYQVQEDGSCYLPILGKVQVAGQDHEALRASLEKQYSKFYQHPQLTLEPLYRVYVTGEVRMPKDYYISGSETVLEVVALAGGPTGSGDMGHVQLIKKKNASRVNLMKAMKEGQSATEIGVESGDVIYVPKTLLARWRDWSILLSILSTGLSVYVLLFR